MVRPQIYVHPCLDLVPPPVHGKPAKVSVEREEGGLEQGGGGLGRARPDFNNRLDSEIEGGLGSTYGGRGRFGGLFGVGGQTG